MSASTPRRWPVLAALVAALALAAAVVVILNPGPQPTSGQSGERCGQPGQVTVDGDGRRLACTTTVADPQPRWRSGQLDLPSR